MISNWTEAKRKYKIMTDGVKGRLWILRSHSVFSNFWRESSFYFSRNFQNAFYFRTNTKPLATLETKQALLNSGWKYRIWNWPINAQFPTSLSKLPNFLEPSDFSCSQPPVTSHEVTERSTHMIQSAQCSDTE